MTDQPEPVLSIDAVLERLSPQAQLEVSNAVLSIQLEQAHARIAELEADGSEETP